MTDKEFSTNAVVFVTYPIVSALQVSENFIEKSDGWKPVSDIQMEFLDYFYTPGKEDLHLIPEIESIAHNDAGIINKWLKERGFDIQLEPFDPGGFGTASMLDLFGHWMVKGNRALVTTDDGEQFPGVKLGESVAKFHQVNHKSDLVVALRTRNKDTVYLMMADEVPTGIDMVQYVQKILQEMTPIAPEYEGVVFPMIDLDIQGSLEWLLMMELLTPQNTVPYHFIQQALQQTKLKVNEEGFRVKSVAAIAGILGAALPRKPPYMINRPFLMWIVRDGLSRPLFVGYLAKGVWRDPGGLDM